MKQKKSREEKKKIRRGIFAASIVLIVVVLGFMIWCAMEGFAADVFYYVPIGVFLVVFCFLTDYLEPKLCGEMDDLTEAQKAAYKRFVVLDVIGYVGLVFFMISLNTFDSMGLLGVAVYVVTTKPRKEARQIFYGNRED